MKHDDYKGLTIIKASAGSGKTHRLTFEYLKLILSDTQKFKNILAVTFTNKATAEMKLRIIEELQILAQTPGESKMIEELSQWFNRSFEEISQTAKSLVKSILHQYAYFNVSTIDQFFQRIIRNLTKELGLNGGFRIQLDQNEIIEVAVDQFLKELTKNEEHMHIMLEYIDAQMDDEKSWNVNRQLIDFTKQLFREQVRYFYIKNNGSLNGNFTTENVKKATKKVIADFKLKAKNWILHYDAIIEKADLQPQDFTGKTKNPLLSARAKLEKKKYSELDKNINKINEQDNWAHKDSDKAQLIESLAPEFDKIANELAEIYNQYLPKYIEAETLQKHIYKHALASGLMKKVSATLADQNLFLIADAPVLLNLFTDGEDTPFIYEKSGRIFRHFMIDEFQDTSVLQWRNFKPLLEESIATGNNGNFVVGDVKQAIYRWRNGDWTLLHKKVRDEIILTNTQTLAENWRSKENIIAFNNLFFSEIISVVGNTLSEKYSKELNEIYSDIEQKIPVQIKEKRRGGYVFIKGIDEPKKDEFIQGSLIELKKQLTILKDNYSIEDICILVRKNAELTAVSEFLINETDYEVISAGALTLGSSDLLQLIITVIKHLNTPCDLYLKTITYLYKKAENKTTDPHSLFNSESKDYLPTNFNELIDSLKQKSGIEIIKELISSLNLIEKFPNQEIFITRFYNEIKHLIFDKGSNFETIIEWWESKGESINIELSETDSKGIKVMTIHKSKGLQFKHVILPFAQWASPNKQDTLWLPGDAFTFEETQGGLFPVNLSKSHLLCENLSQYFEEENFASLVDLINVLYVATTRAEEGLHIFYHRKPHSKTDISRFIEEILVNQTSLSEILIAKEDMAFELGEIALSKQSTPEEIANINISFSSKNKIAVKSTKQNIFNAETYENYAIAKGSFWHKIFERIEYKSQIRSAVTKQHDLGNISAPQTEIIIQQIENWLNKPDIAPWFSENVKIINEADIIVPKNSSKRPDRVVIHSSGTDIIDYKFGQKESDQYIQQVNEYCELFREMGYKNIKGYLWYPLLNKIVPTHFK